MLNNYQKVNNIIGWLVFAIATFVYASTIEPTASFWDCGEYIATTFKLQVGHPPGAPLFQMIGRMFSLLAGDDVTKVAKMVNMVSALSSSFTILFLFWTITAMARKIAEAKGKLSDSKIYIIMGSGIIGALAYTFSDSFWFSAVEGEVYAMSSLFTAAVFWAILKWERVAHEAHSDRWIILIIYLFGLSIGVHLLNLLTVPAIVFIYYFKKYPFSQKSFIIAAAVAVFLLGIIQAGVIPGVVNLAGNFELFFVNSLGLSYNTGTIIYAIMLIAFVVLGILFTHKESPKLFAGFLAVGVGFLLLSLVSAPSGGAVAFRLIVGGGTLAAIYIYKSKVAIINTILLSFTVLLIGYSSFIMLVIRSNANTPMNENAPKDAISLLSYLNREQYGDWPILYGQYYNSPLNPEQPYKDGTPVYVRALQDNVGGMTPVEGSGITKAKGKDKYIISDDRKSSIPNYDPEYCTPFPRMWSSQSNHEAAYRNWGGIERDKKVGSDGREVPVKPKFSENLSYFFSYQINWMFWRYFFWNYVGRQNDVQGHGNVSEGNWITGFDAFDTWRLGSGTPSSVQNNKGHNAFYALPLILGVIGMFYQFSRNNKDAFVVMLLFFFTGLAVVIYLNQYPYQPRERDYAYTGSTYAFAVWIGLGVMAIWEKLKQISNEKLRAVVSTALCFVVPAIMAKEGWDDHDRSNRYTARDLAKAYLDSCEPNAILFTNGDNDTFPLWYVQEVEGYRTDVRVCNLSLLNTDWYINQMKRKAYDSDPVPFSLTEDKYIQGTRDYVPFYDMKIKGNIPVKQLIEFVSSEDPNNKLQGGGGKPISFMPTKNMSIPVDSATVVNNKTVPAELANRVLKSIDWTVDKSYILKNDLMVIDLLATNNWKRPIYFAVTTGPDSYLNLQEYFQLEGLAYRLVPLRATPDEQQMSGTRVATDVMYNNMMNKFTWGNMDKPGVYLDENIQRMCTNLRIQMGTLAAALIQENKKDKAEKILDKALQVMPEFNVPYDATIYSIVMGYYQLNKPEKANPLAKRLFEVYEGDMKFYLNQKNGMAIYGQDVRRAQEIMGRMVYLSKQNKQDALSAELEKRFSVFSQVLNNGAPQGQ